jgi:hypothetical protein
MAEAGGLGAHASPRAISGVPPETPRETRMLPGLFGAATEYFFRNVKMSMRALLSLSGSFGRFRR